MAGVPQVLEPRSRVPPSATLAINELSAKLIKEGKKVHKLGLGQSPFPVPPCMVAALCEHATEKAYISVQGLEPLRAAVAASSSKWRKVNVTANDVMIGPGTKELIFTLQLCYPAELLLPSPSWVSYGPQAGICGRKVTWLPTTAEEGWKLSPAVLDEHCSKQNTPGAPRLLVINYPCNPSGMTFNKADVEALAVVCRKHRILVLSDEIYCGVTYNGNPVSISTYYPEGTIVLDGISKWAGAGGWRMGTFIFAPELNWLLKAMCGVASETFSCVAAPIQYAAIQAYVHRDMPQFLLDQRRVLVLIAGYFTSTLQKGGIKVVPPAGGFYVLADFSGLVSWTKNSDEFAQALLAETGVATLAGTHFGRPAEEITLRCAFVDFDGEAALAALADIGPPEQDTNPAVQAAFAEKYCHSVFVAANKMVEFTRTYNGKGRL
eukprot:CAMPEP_0197846986 /NCGR_PEP_ID=MMETSP1438-20131217/4852_1 /TAXON_ID=1461541 /ORGANISM="Pterosperma sp., Strain CCMP1384" /LENGTH=434 /DNA_ID=CAMNT_0043458779 /DNA_START=105 /DNA_END=1409 /DNA_ORIENTATION=+